MSTVSILFHVRLSYVIKGLTVTLLQVHKFLQYLDAVGWVF